MSGTYKTLNTLLREAAKKVPPLKPKDIRKTWYPVLDIALTILLAAEHGEADRIAEYPDDGGDGRHNAGYPVSKHNVLKYLNTMFLSI